MAKTETPVSNGEIAVAIPGEEIRSARMWRRWISTYFKDFDGDTGVAGQLMSSLCNGSRYLFSKFTREAKLGHLAKPKVGIVTSGNTGSAIAFSIDDNLILVQESYLEEVSKFNIAAIQTTVKPNGETSMIGTGVNIFGLVGVEETHHSIFRQTNGVDQPPEKDMHTISVAEYDSSQVEYEALRWQLKYAREKRMSRVTIAKLSERLNMAWNLRNRKKAIAW